MFFLLVLMLLRICLLNNGKTTLLVLISMVIMIFRCSIIIYNAHRQTIVQEHEVVQTVIIQPDMAKFNGNLVTTIAKTSNGNKYLCNITVSEKSTLIKLKEHSGLMAVDVKGTIQPIIPGTNENQFDSRQFYKTQNVFNSLRGKNVSIKPVTDFKGMFLHVQRAKLIHYFQTFPSPCSYFCNRLLLGYSDIEMNETVKEVQKLGIIHLFCLSGLHVSVLCMFVRKILSMFNFTRERINLIQMFTLPIFWVIGGQSTSLTRAILMIELSLMCQVAKIKSCDTWSLGLLLHTFISPGVLLNLSGQLSYLLSFALCRYKWTNVWQQTMDLNLISFPVLLNATYQVHLLTTLLNYVMIPFFSLVILPGVLICAILGPKITLVMNVCNQGLIFYQGLLHYLAEFPGLIVFGKMPSWLCIVLLICTLLWCENVSASPMIFKILVIGYIFGFLWIHFPIHGEITFFDIGQGDSILIREPFNRTVCLIDTGGQLNFKTPKWQKRTVTVDGAQKSSVNYLKSKGITSINAVLLSHSDEDHIGFLKTICGELNVKSVIVPLGMEHLNKFTKKIPPTVKVIPVTNQDTFNNLPLKVIHPFKKGHGKNEDSMVLYGNFGLKSFLFMGDLDRNGEMKIIKSYPNLKADVVKLGHHGSRTSSAPNFIRKLQPQLAIISAGRHNRYGHPNQETLSTLKRESVPALSTQRQGMIKYNYGKHYGWFKTQLKGDEFSWMR